VKHEEPNGLRKIIKRQRNALNRKDAALIEAYNLIQEKVPQNARVISLVFSAMGPDSQQKVRI